jgi:hypothetical protein
MVYNKLQSSNIPHYLADLRLSLIIINLDKIVYFGIFWNLSISESIRKLRIITVFIFGDKTENIRKTELLYPEFRVKHSPLSAR